MAADHPRGLTGELTVVDPLGVEQPGATANQYRELGCRNVISGLLLNHVSAVSEANGTTVPVSLDLGNSLSIQSSEGSRSRVRRTRGAMGIQSISA